jgi:hypothetical protein
MSRLRATNLDMLRAITFAFWFAVWLTPGCTETTYVVSSKLAGDAQVGGQLDAELDADTPDVYAPDAARHEGGTAPVLCGAAPCACSNGLDDDHDGLVDGFDGECTGPYDQDESSFATGEVKERSPKCAECFFQAKPGQGNDSCRVATSCGIDGTTSISAGNCNNCTPNTACKSGCLSRTPNGCDCFGCCAVQHQGQTLSVRLVETCTLARLDDVDACPRCRIQEQCHNPCDLCELCPGKTLADLGSACQQGDLGFTCGSGKACGGPGDCGLLEYCQQGCCLPFLL